MSFIRLDTDSINFKTGVLSYAKITSTSDGLITLTSNAGNVRITGVGDPVNNQDVATKSYSDSLVIGGSNTQLQYNNNGVLGGITQWTTNGTTTLTGAESSILDLKTNAQIILGTSPITVLTYNGANTTLTASSGDIIVTNSGTGAINLTTPNTNFVNITYGITSNNSYGIVSGLSGQIIPNTTLTKLVGYWNGTPTITGDTISTMPTFSSGTWTVKKNGLYYVSYNFTIAISNTGVRGSFISLNNSTATNSYYAYKNAVSTSYLKSQTSSVILNLSNNDTLSVYVYQSSGTSLSTNALVTGFFEVYRIG